MVSKNLLNNMKARKVFQVKSSKEKQYPLLSYFRAFFLLGLCREGTAGGSCFEALVMGKLICSELDGCGPNFSGLLLALVIAVVLMMTCTPRPRRFAVAPGPVVVYRYG
jgi:hypothetical protein